MKAAFAAGVLAALSSELPATAEPLALTAHRIDNFALAGKDTLNRGLEFLGGLDLRSSNKDFGGLSGISVSADGENAFMIADTGSFVTARLVHESGRLVGISDAEIAPLFPDGNTAKQVSDAEDVAFDPLDPRHGVIVRERQANAMLDFDLTAGRPTHFKPLNVGAENEILRSNKGLESVTFAPAGSPLAGKLLAIAERPPEDTGDIPGWIAGIGKFGIVRHDDYDVSSARFSPGGDLFLLERRYSPAWGIAMRIRRIPGQLVKAGARLDGPYLIDAGMASQIDNMEGLSIHRGTDGRTVLTLVSDDNHSILQRTLILQFAIAAD